MNAPSIWQIIVSQGSALVLGAVGGGLFSALVTWRMLRSETARRLLADALAIQAEMEAWVLEGPGYGEKKLSENGELSTTATPAGLWLRPVEVRAVLDEAMWNSPADQCYDFIGGRRTWIIRDAVTGSRAYSGALREGWHPALLSSRALEDLCGWVEQVAISRQGWMLSDRGLDSLKPLLQAVCTADRLSVLGNRLSKESQEFLAATVPDKRANQGGV